MSTWVSTISRFIGTPPGKPVNPHTSTVLAGETIRPRSLDRTIEAAYGRIGCANAASLSPLIIRTRR